MRAIAGAAGEELRCYVGHHAGDRYGIRQGGLEGKAKVPEHLGEDLGAGAGGHGFWNKVARARGEETVAPENVNIGRLGEEMGLVGDNDAEKPVAVFEGDEGAGTWVVVGEGGDAVEEVIGFKGYSEGFPVGFWDAGGEVGGVAEVGGVVGEGFPKSPGAVTWGGSRGWWSGRGRVVVSEAGRRGHRAESDKDNVSFVDVDYPCGAGLDHVDLLNSLKLGFGVRKAYDFGICIYSVSPRVVDM